MKTTQKLTTLFLLHAFASHLARAQVNMADGSFERKEKDLLIQTQTQEFEVHRVYKSRSLYQGDFGIGWCSNIDLRLEIKTPQLVQVAGCFQKSPLSFQRQKERFFRSSDGRSGKLLKLSQGWLWVLSKDRSFLYSDSGQLTAISLSTQAPLEIERDPQGRVIKITQSSRSLIEYAYVKNHLVRAKSNNEELAQYKYDRTSNLNQISQNQKIVETLTYDAVHDRVTARKNRHNCIEVFTYAETNLASSVERLCPGEALIEQKFEFQLTAKNALKFKKMTTSQGPTTGWSQTSPRMGGAFTTKDVP